MKLLSIFQHKSVTLRKKQKVKTTADYEQEVLIKIGREQFKKLAEKGLRIPVVLL